MDGPQGNNGSHNGQTGVVPYGLHMAGVVGEGSSLFHIVWRSWWLIVLCVLLAGGGAYLYLREVKPTYTSVSRVLVEKPGGRRMEIDPWEPGVESTNLLQTQAALMTSREIQSIAMNDPNNPDIVALLGLHGETYVGEVFRNLSATVSKNADIINVSASAPDPNHAAIVVNAVVQAHKRWLRLNRRLSAAELLGYLNSELRKRTDEFNSLFRQKVALEKRNPQFVEGTRGGMILQRLDLLRQELAGARLEATDRASYLAGLQQYVVDANLSDVNAPDPNRIDLDRFRMYVSSRFAATVPDTELSRLKQELYVIQSEMETIAAGTERRLDVQRLDLARLQSRQQQLEARIRESEQAFIQNHLSLAKTLADEAKAREKRLEDNYNSELAAIEELGGEESQYALVLSQCNMLESLCNSLIEQIKNVSPDTGLDNLKVHVIEPAVAVATPSWPEKKRVFGIGLVLGLMLGGGLAFVRDTRDHRIRSADEITAILGVPVLGAVPSISRRRLVGHGRQSLHAPGAPQSESFRAIRTALLFGASREQAKTILITSPGTLEGKTTLVSNLGIVMAQAGQRTLIIDADLRKPMQHRIFTKDGHDHGLTDMLDGRVTSEEAIRPTDVDGLDVLESGGRASNPSELLNSKGFATLLEQLEGSYDRILVDSPPVGMVTDAQILAAHIDLTLMVLRAGRTTRTVTQQARDALLSVEARLAGAVVNDVPKRNKRYSHYGVYGYRDGYRSSNNNVKASKALPANIDSGPDNETSTPDEQG